MAEVLVAAFGLLRHLRAHLGAVVAMEGVALDVGGVTFSRRKICSKVFLTDVVPAPEEPVMEMIGCLRDIGRLPQTGTGRAARTAARADARTAAAMP